MVIQKIVRLMITSKPAISFRLLLGLRKSMIAFLELCKNKINKRNSFDNAQWITIKKCIQASFVFSM